MTVSIPDLWPSDIQAETLHPLTILRTQARYLESRVKGNLTAQVREVDSAIGRTWQFDVVVPRLNTYRSRLFSIHYGAEQPYPVTVEAPVFESKPGSRTPLQAVQPAITALMSLDPMRGKRLASTDEQLITLLGEVIRSDQTRAAISSILARINELDAVETSSSSSLPRSGSSASEDEVEKYSPEDESDD